MGWAGLSEVEIARRLGRTASGIRCRLAWLLPPELDLPKSEVAGWLRATLTAA
jgi:hypothetical protein